MSKRTNPEVHTRRLFLSIAFVVCFANGRLLAQNPSGGVVAQGSATILPQGDTLTINQNSSRAVINWNSFSIGPGATTQFNVPSSAAATLNRVTGGDPSSIMGSLRSNGQVFLINPNGIVFGANSQVNVGSLVASTLDVDNHQFMRGGDLRFQGDSNAKVVNHGSLNAIGGDIYLIGAHVENHGSIHAPNGTVGLAGGQDVRLVDSANPRLVVQPTHQSIGSVVNTGDIHAVRAELAAHGNVYALAINNTGTVRATGAVRKNGRVLLTANHGNIKSTGKLITQSPQGRGKLEVRAKDGHAHIDQHGTREQHQASRKQNVQHGTMSRGPNTMLVGHKVPRKMDTSHGPHSGPPKPASKRPDVPTHPMLPSPNLPKHHPKPVPPTIDPTGPIDGGPNGVDPPTINPSPTITSVPGDGLTSVSTDPREIATAALSSQMAPSIDVQAPSTPVPGTSIDVQSPSTPGPGTENFGSIVLPVSGGDTESIGSQSPSRISAGGQSAIGRTPRRRDIGGRVWNDANGNGKYDEGEEYLNGQKVRLVRIVGSTKKTRTFKHTKDRSNQAGWYEFLNADPTDELLLEKKSGWKQTFPPENGNHSVSDERSYNFGVTQSSGN